MDLDFRIVKICQAELVEALWLAQGDQLTKMTFLDFVFQN